MEAEKFKQILINKNNLDIIDNLIDCLEKYQTRLIDSDMPYLEGAPDIYEELDYYTKVRDHIINELKEQQLNL